MNTKTEKTVRGRSIRFEMVTEICSRGRARYKRRVPSLDGLDGAAECAARMVRVAIYSRESAAAEVRQGMPKCAAMKRRSMRHDALWARVFAGQIEVDDLRLKELKAISKNESFLGYRALILRERFGCLRNALYRLHPDDAKQARIKKIMARIASRHDAITPFDWTLGGHIA